MQQRVKSPALDATEGDSFDLIVIGAGPAGEKGAAQAAYFGKRVAVVECGAPGGAVGAGTLPSKTLRQTALYLSGMRSRGLYGIDYSFSRAISVDDLFYRQRAVEQEHLAAVRDNLRRHAVTLFAGRARIEGAHTVTIQRDGGEITISGDYILVATGSRPQRPDDITFDGERAFDAESILDMRALPESMVIIGAGAIGTEYATVFATLGLRVTLIDGSETFLAFLDRELAEVLADGMREIGVEIVSGRRYASVTQNDRGVSVTLDNGTLLGADAVLYCAGRSGNTDGLGLESLGIRLDARGRVIVDEHFRTAVPSIFAAGDVIGFPALASTSMEQGRVAVCQAFGFGYKREVSSLVPYALYTIPEVSLVGATEDALQKAGTPYLVGRSKFEANARAQIAGDTSGLVKLLFDPESRTVLGVQIIGERASELIHVGQMCMRFGGTIDAFIDNVFNFPSLGEAYKLAAYDGLHALEHYVRETPQHDDEAPSRASHDDLRDRSLGTTSHEKGAPV
jgi:NAD(P) transhydrogenase